MTATLATAAVQTGCVAALAWAVWVVVNALLNRLAACEADDYPEDFT